MFYILAVTKKVSSVKISDSASVTDNILEIIFSSTASVTRYLDYFNMWAV